MENIKSVLPIYAKTQKANSFNVQDLADLVKEEIVGNGFFAEGSYFFTAAHVINDTHNDTNKSEPYIKIDDKKIELKLENAIVFKELPYDDEGRPKDHHLHINGDIAIFKLEGIESIFVLSESLPKHGQTLKNSYYVNRYDKEELKESVAIIHDAKDFKGNFYSATMIPSHPTTGGSSGSPLFIGDTVYGILHAGGNTVFPDVCVFYSAAHALQLLSEHSTL